jgi:hypothetical protein
MVRVLIDTSVWLDLAQNPKLTPLLLVVENMVAEGLLSLIVPRVKRVERELGQENIGPWSDFEWGMINGKLSALRWVLGDEWDMLDT